jgi:hypothetical protein
MRAQFIAVGAAFMVCLASCGGDSPAGPSGNSIVTGLTVNGPSQIAPGETARFTATGKFSDGSTQDVTTRATWFGASGVVRLSGPGQFEGLQPGETRVGASFGRFSSQSQPLLVLPPGTFKLSGSVRDESGVIEGVAVEARYGGASKTVTTSRDGKYAFYGVAGPVELLASARGYETQDLTFTINDHTVRDVSLATTAMPLELAGAWTFSVSASSPCSDAWPEATRHAEVTANITQQGTRLDVRFNGSSVVGTLQNPGRIAGTAFSLTIDFDDYYLDYGLLVRPNPTDWVGVFGTAEGTGDQSAIRGTFKGRFDYYVTQASARFLQGVAQGCAANPEFTLRRQ